MKGYTPTASPWDPPYADLDRGEEFDADRFDDPVMLNLNRARAA